MARTILLRLFYACCIIILRTGFSTNTIGMILVEIFFISGKIHPSA